MSMFGNLTAVAIVLTALALVGCDPDAREAKGFSLPEGNLETGEKTYLALRCNDCHSIPGIPQNPSAQNNNISVKLGGEVSSIKTYGELVTSVINPSHRIAKGYPPTDITVNGQSKMRNYNDVMTVTQLVDLVTFLQSKYSLRLHTTSEYEVYYP